jgi:mannitol 2-dehydrogenase
MSAQDCLYTLVLRHPEGALEPRVIGSVLEYLFAPDAPEAVLERLRADECVSWAAALRGARSGAR